MAELLSVMPDASLGAVQVRLSVLLIAAVVAWMMCVCIHEFSHALVAYWGGDRGVRERGYLTLDPTRFIDPIASLLIPAIVLMMGGIPLPGGAVLIDEASLKSRRWGVYVAAAGPASNLVLFLLFALPLNPVFGLVEPLADLQPTWVYFFGAMAVLNFIGALFNLIPIPPLDGYRLIEHRLNPETQFKLRQPGVSMATFGMLFLFFVAVPGSMRPFFFMLAQVADRLGVPMFLLAQGYNFVLFGES